MGIVISARAGSALACHCSTSFTKPDSMPLTDLFLSESGPKKKNRFSISKSEPCLRKLDYQPS